MRRQVVVSSQNNCMHACMHASAHRYRGMTHRTLVIFFQSTLPSFVCFAFVFLSSSSPSPSSVFADSMGFDFFFFVFFFLAASHSSTHTVKSSASPSANPSHRSLHVVVCQKVCPLHSLPNGQRRGCIIPDSAESTRGKIAQTGVTLARHMFTPFISRCCRTTHLLLRRTAIGSFADRSKMQREENRRSSGQSFRRGCPRTA